MTQSTAARQAGRSAWTGRIEDDALLARAGRFGDDVKPEGALAAYFVRSPHAFANIERIDTSGREEGEGRGRGAHRRRSRSGALPLDLASAFRFPAAEARWRSGRIGRRWRRAA